MGMLRGGAKGARGKADLSSSTLPQAPTAQAPSQRVQSQQEEAALRQACFHSHLFDPCHPLTLFSQLASIRLLCMLCVDVHILSIVVWVALSSSLCMFLSTSHFPIICAELKRVT